MSEEKGEGLQEPSISKGPTMEKKNIIAALVKAQLNIRPPKKSGTNPMFKNKYSTYDDIMNAVRIPLAEQGIVPLHRVEGEELVTVLLHVSGETLESSFPLRVEKNNSQGVASANTYAKRQGMSNILALPSDDDDDANAACQEKGQEKMRERISVQQKEMIEEYIGEDAALADRILRGYKVKSFAELESKNFSAILNGIKKVKGSEAPLESIGRV